MKMVRAIAKRLKIVYFARKDSQNWIVLNKLVIGPKAYSIVQLVSSVCYVAATHTDSGECSGVLRSCLLSCVQHVLSGRTR